MPGNTRSVLPVNRTRDLDDPAPVSEVTSKARGRTRYCKKCKFTCTDAREFTVHLVTHSESQSKQDSKLELAANSEKLPEAARGQGHRLQRSKHNSKTSTGPVTTLVMEAPAEHLVDASMTEEDGGAGAEDHLDGTAGEADPKTDVDERMEDDDDEDEPDAIMELTTGHQGGIDKLDTEREMSGDEDVEEEGKLVIDDDGSLIPGQEKRVYTCNQCQVMMASPKSYLRHLQEEHATKARIYECDKPGITSLYRNNQQLKAKENSPVTSNISTRESEERDNFLNVSRSEGLAKTDLEDMEDDNGDSPNPAGGLTTSVPLTITTENIDQVLDDDKKKKKKTRQEVDPGKYFEAVDSSGTKYACSQCGNIYKWRKSLNKHWKEKHSLDPLVEVASPPGMLELLKSGKYTQLGARRIYDNIFLSTIKTQKDDSPQQQPSSPNSLAQSPSPPNFLNSSQPLASNTSRLPTSLMPKMIGPFVASTAQPVFPGMTLTIPHLPNGYDSPEESALDLTRDVKPDLQGNSPYSVVSCNDFSAAFDQEQPLDFSTKKDNPVKHEKLWDDLHDMKPSHSINQYIPKVHRCSKCEYTSTSEVEFANHTSSHLNKRIVKCNQCKIQINSMDELNNHFLKLHFKKLTEHKEAIKKIPHGLQQTYHLLKMDLQDIGELSNQDLGASESKSLKCKKCEFEAKWPAELQKHAVSHSEERPYVCMVCGSTYKWKWDLVKHFQKSHPNLPNPYRRNDKRDTPDGSSDDDIDDEPDIKRQKMDNHNDINGGIFGRDDIISIEGIMAATQAGQRVVSSQPNILDDEPQGEQNQPFFKGLPFGVGSELSQAHMTAQELVEHRSKAQKAMQDAVRGRQGSANVKKVIREQTSPIPVVSKPEELPYKCTMCNYHARWPSEVTQHMKNHSDSKPYLCPRCEYRSKWKWDVVKHLKRCGGGGINDVIDTTKTRRRDAMANSQGPPNAIVCQQGKVKKLTSQSPSSYLQSSADESGVQSGVTGGPTSSQNSALSSGDDLSRASSSASTLDLSCNSNNNDSGAVDNNANNNYAAYTNGQPFSGFSNSSAPTASNSNLSHSPSHSPPAPPITTTSSRQSSGGEVWNCPHCPFTTASQAELKRHSGLHSDDKPFKCDVCQYSTRWACDLKKHRKSYNHFPAQVNREEKEKVEKTQSHGRFKCSHCSLFFHSLQSLLEHRVAEHIGRDAQQPLPAPLEQNEIDAARIKHPRKPIKQLQCPKCSFVCKNRQTMEKHKEEHDQLDTSGFQCFYCSSQFKEKESLLDHMSTHSAFNPKEWETFFMISEEDDHHTSKDDSKPGSHVDGGKKATGSVASSCQQRSEPLHRESENEELVNSTEARIQQILSEVPKQVTKQSPQPCQQTVNKFPCEWCPAEFVNLTAVYKHASQAHPIQLKEQDVSMTLSAGAKFAQQNSSKKPYSGEPIEILRQQIAEKRNQQLAEKLNEMITKNPKMQEVLSKKLEEGSKRYNCDKCSFSSANMATFQRHYDLHGSKLTSQCWFCDYSVDRMNLLYQHMKISHTRKWKALSQDPKYANQIHRMNQAFSNAAVSGNNNDSPPDAAGSRNEDSCAMDLSSKHKSTEVTLDIMYITKQQYTWSGIPVNVIPVGNALNFVCPHCAFKDASIAKTCAHVMQSHRAIAKFTCKKCQFSDDNIHVMSDHCKTTHPVHDRVVVVMDFKQLNFSELQMVQLAASRERVQEDGTKTMSCPFCPYKTLVTENMKNHISNHSRQARYRCQICDFSSDLTSVISEHVKVHDLGYTIDSKRNTPQVKEEVKVNAIYSESSREDVETPVLPPDKDTATKVKSVGRIRYRCLVCPFYTSCKSNILKHKRQHQHNKRYKCNKCSYSAARAVLLKKHLDAHDSQVEDDGLHHDIFYDPNDASDDSKLDDADEMEEAEMEEDEFDDDETNSEELDEIDAKAIADLEAKDILEAEAAHKANAFSDDDPGTDNGDRQFRKQKCPHCPFSSNSGYEFRKHLNFHGTQERYKCDYCSYSLDRLNLLSQHRKLHADEPEYNPNPPAADLLNTQFIFQQNLSEKMQLEDFNEKLDEDDISIKQYPCQFCPYKTLKKKSLDIHQNSHGLRRRYVCDFCDWSADRLALLCQHRKVHEGEPSFDASPEDSVFLNHEFDDGATGEFEAKFMEVKTLDKSAKEGEADALLSPPFKLTVVKKIYPCQLCPYKTNSKSSYSVHTGMHGSDAEFNCVYCSYAAPSRGLLQQHMQLHSTADEPVAMTREVKIKNEDESSKTCGEVSDSDPGVKPDAATSDILSQPQLKCQRCPFTAVSKSLLSEHTLGHMTQDSIVCPYCDFSTTSKNLMLPHIQVHFPGAKLDPDTLELNLIEQAQVFLEGKTVNNNNNQAESDKKQHAIVKPYKVDEEAVKTKRVYVCQYCEREFEAKHLMIQHEKQHLVGSH